MVLILFPLFLFSYYYPIEFKFQFMHSCLQNAPIERKYEYCNCVYHELTQNYPFYKLNMPKDSNEIINTITKASIRCLKP